MRVVKKKPTTSEHPETIAAIVQELVEVYGSQRKFARAFGISESRAGKLMREGQDNLTLYNLLMLAKLSKYSPFVVLEAAGKKEAADLLRELFGDKPQNAVGLTAEERAFAVKWHSLPPRVQALMKDLAS